MLPAIFKNIITPVLSLIFIGSFWASLASATDTTLKSELIIAYKDLFSHKGHQTVFKGSNISCTDCHSFAIKSASFDPLAPNVESPNLFISRKVCHECHLGKVEVARVNQCSLCHKYPEKLAPANHELGWKTRHGPMAQMNPDSCTSCHKENQNSCTNCHSQRNTMKPIVHRPNFRMTHSIEARMNPAKCSTCHSSISFCIQCHKGDKK